MTLLTMTKTFGKLQKRLLLSCENSLRVRSDHATDEFVNRLESYTAKFVGYSHSSYVCRSLQVASLSTYHNNNNSEVAAWPVWSISKRC